MPTRFLTLRFPQHERGVHPLAGAVELDEPAVVDQPVDDGRGELVVAEHGAPLAELDVRGHDHAPLLVAVAHHLEEQPRSLYVQGHVAEFVQDEELRSGQVLQIGFVHRGLEQPRGEAYYYALGNGSKDFERMRVRTPTSQNLAGMTPPLAGCDVADVPMIILTIDPCISCTER